MSARGGGLSAREQNANVDANALSDQRAEDECDRFRWFCGMKARDPSRDRPTI